MAHAITVQDLAFSPDSNFPLILPPSPKANNETKESLEQVPIEKKESVFAAASKIQTTINLKGSAILARVWDHERVEANERLKEIICQKGKGPEKIIYSGFEIKVNRRKLKQRRLLVITEKAMYNVGPPDFYNVKRRILIEKISAISISETGNEFIVHVFDEYDYRYRSERTELIVDILQYEFKRVARRGLEIFTSSEKRLDSVIVTRDIALIKERRDEIRNALLGISPTRGSISKEKGAEAVPVDLTSGKSDSQVRLEDFEVMKVIGRGALGKVVLVQEKTSKTVYAMKILKKVAVYDKQQMDHIRLERDIMESFQHPFLVGLRFAFQNDTRLYLVMDFFKGGELYFHLQKKKKFSEVEVQFLGAEILLGLGHLHRLNYAYRDLKPENILMDHLGHVCLTDFNTVKQFQAPDERAYSFIGTPEYLAPEVIKVCGHDKSVDWWCFGVLLFELSCGVTPFSAGNIDQIYEKILNSNGVKYPPRMSDDLVDLISKLLVHDPKKRLGAGPSDVEEIKSHKFFKNIDWEKLLKRELVPVYRPPMESSADSTLHFKKELTTEKIVDSYVPTNKNFKDLEEFKRWTFNHSKKSN